MLKNTKIGKRLIFYFLLIAIISGIGSAIGLCVMTNIVSSYRYALANYGFSQGIVGKFNAEFNNSCAIIRDMVIETSQQEKLKSADELKQSNTKINEYFANIKPTLVDSKEIGYYNSIKDNLLTYQDINNQVVTLAIQNRNDDAHQLLIGKGVAISDSIKASVDSLLDRKTTNGNQLSTNLFDQSKMSTGVMIVIILVSLIISLLIALRISHGISKPVSEMAKAAQKMAEGDLSVLIDVKTNDEIGQLGVAFSETILTLSAYITDITTSLAKIAAGDLTTTTNENFQGDFVKLKESIDHIVLSLNDAISQISQTSKQVFSGSDQVANSAQALAQGATEQACSIEELSATIIEISENAKQNAVNAAGASKSVSHVSTELETSNRHMQDMILAMSQISHSSSEIGKIIKTIEDIAFQTNILALNAAVEAARAGAAGKGFTVVADEVRNLASKSAEAAKSTTSLIQNSTTEVEKGTKIANTTAAALSKVVLDAKAAVHTIELIAQISNQQADSIEVVKLGVDQISAVVQTNSATAEQSASASEELSGQAEIMNELVEKFKLTTLVSNRYSPAQPNVSEAIQSSQE